MRALAADVLRLRFRLAQSVDYQVAAAALDAGLINAEELARSIARRTSGLILGAAVVWILAVDLLDIFVDYPAVALRASWLRLP